MKISVTGGGGFAGTLEHYEVETKHLPQGDALEALLQNLDFFHAHEAPPAVGADIARWEITVDDGQQCRTVAFAEDGGPACARWKPLLDRLRGAG
ncbi:hypothetical protein HHL21_20230 [Massilia sp. RP-1-19]|uniref:Uncharacterized protein n=1 Tax=Massilia polaris TaxID=2728846 RepID=A0A848HVQ5_9BURK|nr:protealysin inhibitor emfourin [Massilia polaris]NML63373.1 hypothetical protein [Massilia polaris]